MIRGKYRRGDDVGHIKTLCYKGMHWVWIQKHIQKDFNLCKGLKIYIRWAVMSKINFNS